MHFLAPHLHPHTITSSTIVLFISITIPSSSFQPFFSSPPLHFYDSFLSPSLHITTPPIIHHPFTTTFQHFLGISFNQLIHYFSLFQVQFQPLCIFLDFPFVFFLFNPFPFHFRFHLLYNSSAINYVF